LVFWTEGHRLESSSSQYFLLLAIVVIIFTCIGNTSYWICRYEYDASIPHFTSSSSGSLSPQNQNISYTSCNCHVVLCLTQKKINKSCIFFKDLLLYIISVLWIKCHFHLTCPLCCCCWCKKFKIMWLEWPPSRQVT